MPDQLRTYFELGASIVTLDSSRRVRTIKQYTTDSNCPSECSDHRTVLHQKSPVRGAQGLVSFSDVALTFDFMRDQEVVGNFEFLLGDEREVIKRNTFHRESVAVFFEMMEVEILREDQLADQS
ncbi:hypothetical protein KOR42_50970 [Thalassoglobus neptunius]|uniref:Uncharacterized protein n=1 Tax=Thalassoglobus neptunius TaxID=1938619 RepID=A0A5C5VQJ3_9PLAN|nr:hypothetical protein KOR42_50970 [Thalassoglobus neptunius]